MPSFLLKVRYSSDGIQSVMKDGGSVRQSAAEKIVQELGGTLEGFWFAFGEDDAFAVCTLPDNKAAAALAMTVTGSGKVAISTVPLLTVAEVDAVASGRHPSYAPPG